MILGFSLQCNKYNVWHLWSDWGGAHEEEEQGVRCDQERDGGEGEGEEAAVQKYGFFWTFDIKEWHMDGFLLIFWWRWWQNMVSFDLLMTRMTHGWMVNGYEVVWGGWYWSTPEMLRGRSTSPWAGELGSFVLHLLIFHLVGFWWDDQWAPQAGEPGKICFGSHSLCLGTVGSGWHWQSNPLRLIWIHILIQKYHKKTWTKQNRFLTPPSLPLSPYKMFHSPLPLCPAWELRGGVDIDRVTLILNTISN